MKMVRGVLAGACLLVTLVGRADAASGWTTWGTITSFQEYGLGAEVETSAPLVKPNSCTGTRYRISSTLTDAGKDRLSRTLLAAHLAGKSVRLKIDDVCTTDNMPGYYAVDIAP